MKNGNLHRAKKEKNDEFYTQLVDIEKELSYYTDYFKGKVVYCNCDDYRISNFIVYFKENFEYLGLKRLISTNYGDAWHYEYDGDAETVEKMNGNGDFRSEECIEFLKESDVVVTNPPFSLFRSFIKQMIDLDKKFIIIGNGNAVTYKEIFPLIKENKMWLGNKAFSGGMDMLAGKNYDAEKCKHPKYDERGNLLVNVMMCVWFTNVDHNKRNTPITLYKTYSADKYPKYDNYDAIEVDNVNRIPCDYDGVMGVPITFLDKYCPSQFEIVKFRKGDDDKDLAVNGKTPYFRILIKRKVS